MTRGSFDTHRVPMGPCECPGKPHGEDEAVVKDRFTFGDIRKIAWAMQQADFLAQTVTVVCGVVEWNLLYAAPNGHGGSDIVPLPVDVEAFDSFEPEQARFLLDEFSKPEYDRQLRRGLKIPEPVTEGEVPNPSGETSQDGLAEPSTSPSKTSIPEP